MYIYRYKYMNMYTFMFLCFHMYMYVYKYTDADTSAPGSGFWVFKIREPLFMAAKCRHECPCIRVTRFRVSPFDKVSGIIFHLSGI